jgi:hypothetical protein
MADEKPHYRDGTAAGFKGSSKQARRNGREAAQGVTETLPRRHRQMMNAWAPYGALGAIPEQIAADLSLPLLCVRPRAGELVRRGLLFEVGRRMGGMGCRVTAYSVVKPAEAAAEAA